MRRHALYALWCGLEPVFKTPVGRLAVIQTQMRTDGNAQTVIFSAYLNQCRCLWMFKMSVLPLLSHTLSPLFFVIPDLDGLAECTSRISHLLISVDLNSLLTEATQRSYCKNSGVPVVVIPLIPMKCTDYFLRKRNICSEIQGRIAAVTGKSPSHRYSIYS